VSMRTQFQFLIVIQRSLISWQCHHMLYISIKGQIGDNFTLSMVDFKGIKFLFNDNKHLQCRLLARGRLMQLHFCPPFGTIGN
jgi:hypothetical protein